MRYIFTCSILIMLFSACTTYRYATLSSPDTPQNAAHQFVSENDTVKLVYDFHGENGPVQITAFNKLDQPIMLDLNRSVLIVHNRAIGLNSGQVDVSSSVNTSVNTVGGVAIASTSGTVGASTLLPQGQLFIPAGTFASHTATVSLADNAFDQVAFGRFRQEPTSSDGNVPLTGIARFTASASPLAFRTMLTFVQPGSDKTELVRQNSFYVSDIMQTPARPGRVGYNDMPAGDRFYVSKTKKSAGAVVALTGLAVLATFLIVSFNHTRG